MNFKNIKNELQYILSGKSYDSRDSAIQAATNYIRTSNSSSPTSEKKFKNKPKEETKLIQFAKENNLLIKHIDSSKFISSGAEQKVYILSTKDVIKINDAIYYASWEDYFYNLLLHNYFFSDTNYTLLGFYLDPNKTLYAVVKQAFVISDENTDVKNIKIYMNRNGFNNTRNNDYYHPELGIILEDLHEENVLTQKHTLYFIDTVFYISPEIFWD